MSDWLDPGDQPDYPLGVTMRPKDTPAIWYFTSDCRQAWRVDKQMGNPGPMDDRERALLESLLVHCLERLRKGEM